MSNWRERFDKLVEEIRSHPMLRLDRSEIRAPASEADIDRALHAAGGTLPDGVADLYRQMDGASIEWSTRGEIHFETKDSPTGAINLLPLIRDRGESIFGSWKNVVWFSEDDKFRRVAPFDLFTPEAGSVFYPMPGEMKVHYHYLGETLSSTGRTFLEYLELLLKARGYLYWPMSLCADEQGSVEVEYFRTNLPKLFNEDTAQAFRPTP